MRGFILAAAVLLAWAGTAAAAQRDAGPVAPDPKLTPGVARKDIAQDEICATRWGKDRRHVTRAMKGEVFSRYGLSGPQDPACRKDGHGRRYEIDHLISREIGGADDVDNLWPQCYGGKPWNAVLKDRLENRLHKEVCSGAITLEDAQQGIARDWRGLYQKYFGNEKEK